MSHDSSTPEPTSADFPDEITPQEPSETTELQPGNPEFQEAQSVGASDVEIEVSALELEIEEDGDSTPFPDAIQDSSVDTPAPGEMSGIQGDESTLSQDEPLEAEAEQVVSLEVDADEQSGQEENFEREESLGDRPLVDEAISEAIAAESAEQPQTVAYAPSSPKESALDTIGNFVRSVFQLIRKVVQAIVPLFRAIVVLILRFVIQILQLLLDLFEGSPTLPSPSSSADNLTDTAGATPLPVASSKQKRSLLSAVGAVWRGLINLVRAVLPDTWNQKLPTPLLNLVLAGAIALALWITPSILFPRSAPKVATQPPQSEIPDSSVPPALDVTDRSEDVQDSKPLPRLSGETEIPLDEIVSESGDLELPPVRGFAPSQRKSIETLQKQLVDLRNRYDSMPLLIQSAHVNAKRDRLTVELGEDWYELSPRRQDRLAEDLWQRAQQASLPKLLLIDGKQIIDGKQTVLARSPMVGQAILILQRQHPVAPAVTPETPEDT